VTSNSSPVTDLGVPFLLPSSLLILPLVSPEKTAADKQRNRRVLVQLAKCSGRKAAEL